MWLGDVGDAAMKAVRAVGYETNDEIGAIFATVVQQPYEFGYQAIKLMDKVLNGDKSAIPADKKIIVPTLGIDKASVDEFAAKLKKQRGK